MAEHHEEIMTRQEETNRLLESILSELKKLNSKEEAEDFVHQYDNFYRRIKFDNIIIFDDKDYGKDNRMVYIVDNEVYLQGTGFYLKGDERIRFLKWFEEQKQRRVK